jgi:anti-sigma factor RsiW
MTIRLWRRSELACQEIVELASDYLEGALSRCEHERFERHLAGCPHCTEYLAQMRATIVQAGRLKAEDLTPSMQEHFLELYRRWREDAAG